MIGKRKLLVVGLACLTVAVLVSCQSTATPTLATSSQPGIGVGISDDSCPNVVVEVGQQISWTNQGNQEHIVRATSVEGERAFDSGTLKPGDSFVVTLTEPGIHQYECSADGSSTGMITLQP
jgi:plastocyanin